MSNVIHVNFIRGMPPARHHIIEDQSYVSPVLTDVSPYLLKPLRSYQQAAQDYNLKRMKEVLSVLRAWGINPEKGGR